MQRATETRRPRSEVSDGKLREALANTDFSNVLKSVLRQYARQVPEDDLENCGLHAMWRALQYHREGYGQKFTTTLYRFAHWECRRHLRRQQLAGKDTLSLSNMGELPSRARENNPELRQAMTYVRECMRYMSSEQRGMIEEYYFGQYTMDEIASKRSCSKEAVRVKLDGALRRLRQLCAEADAVY